jgi:hypothetical protein
MAEKLSRLEAYLSGKLANELTYAGDQFKKGNIPYVGKPRFTPEQMRSMTAPGLVRYPANVGSNGYSGVIGSIPPSANGESYRRAELRLADAARPGGGGGGGGNAGYSVSSTAGSNYQPVADRAYGQFVSRAAQLTAQDPELKRYEKAREEAAAQGFTPESVKTAEDIGMQIWAKKYGGPGGLASKVKPGQAGYDVIQNTINPGAAPQGLSAYGKAGTEYDYRDYGEPQSPTVGYQMQSPITSVPGLNATTAQQVNTGAQVQAQDLADLFKNAVFDEELMKQIQQYN